MTILASLGLTADPAAAHVPPGPNSVTAYGASRQLGPEDGMTLNRDVVGMAPTPSGQGYWLVAGDGGIFTFGDAAFHGSTGDIALNEPIVGIAAHPDGGYWLAASDGGVFTFGHASFHGSMGGEHLNQPVLGIAPTPTGDGYWLVAADGGIFSFGDASFHGSTGDIALNQPITGMAATPTGDGYWLVARDGGVFTFGDARFHGSLGDRTLSSPVRGMAPSSGGRGYWLALQDGRVFNFDVPDHGSATHASQQVATTVGIAAHPTESGFWLAHGGPPLPDDVVVSTFTTPLVPGEPRNNNIHLAADYLDGSVIAPGERFSLNQGIGPRTTARGFGPNGYIDDGGDIISVVGGGVSQIGTTFLNAAWSAGIELVEFRQHTIYFERYPMCREATLDWGVLDVVVVNDSPYPLTVSTSYTGSSVTVSLVGTPWAEVSSWTGAPYAVEGPGGAFSVSCGRTVRSSDGTTTSESYTWRYDEGYPG